MFKKTAPFSHDGFPNVSMFWTSLFLCLSRYYLSDVCQHLTPCLYGFVRICVFLPDMTHTMSQFLLPVPPWSNIQWRKSVAPPFLVKVGLYLYMSVTNQKITNLIWNKYRLLIDQVFPHNITRTNLRPNSYSIIDRPMGKSLPKEDIVHTWSV